MKDDPLLEAAGRVLSEAFPHAAHSAIEKDGFASYWSFVTELGLPYAMVPEEAGGFGASRESAWALLRLTGAHGLPLPIAETMIANHLLAQAGMPIDDTPTTIAGGASLRGTRSAGGIELKGELPNVSWGGGAANIVASAQIDGSTALVRLSRTEVTVLTHGHNIARHPRDTLAVDFILPDKRIAAFADADDRIEAAGMAMRTCQLAGAMATALDLTVKYTGERSQFGRTLSKFQAIQQELAKMAGQVAAASAAADMASEAADDLSRMPALYASKARASEAAGQVASIAHQTHGAMGFAAEHALPIFTRALWSWRDEFGTQGACWRSVGDLVLAQDADAFWSMITEF